MTAPMRYRTTRSFVTLLDALGCTLAVTAYVSGRLVLIGAADGRLIVRSHELDRPMGIAIDARHERRRIGISTRTCTLVFAESSPLIAEFSTTERPCDAVFMPRAVWYSGDIDGHDAAWIGDDLIVANTRFSCLARVSGSFGFEPVWWPPFITASQPEDRCHLNGLAVNVDGAAYATGLGAGDTPRAWRDNRQDGGFLIDVRTNRMILESLCVPHSPRLFGDELFVCDSGQGRVLRVDPNTRISQSMSELPGFARGLDAAGGFFFVGLSQPRATSNWRPPIAERRDDLICGIAAIDRATGAMAGWLALEDFTEIFDVRVLHGMRAPVFASPGGPESQRSVDLPGRAFMMEGVETDAGGSPAD